MSASPRPTSSSAPTSSFSQRLTARLYACVLFVLRCCDVRLVALVGKAVGYIAWVCVPSRRRIVQRNLRIAINPNLRPAELSTLSRRNIVLTCMNFACALKVGLMSPKEMARFIRLEGKEIFEESGTGGRTGIACIPHAGNWEVLARIRPLFTRVDHFASMYRRMGNPALEDIVYKSRTRFGCEMYSKEAGVRGVLRMAKQGGLLGVLSDQFTQEGLWVPYFGKITGTTPLPSVLRKMCKGQLFSVFTRNRGLGKWDAVLGRTIELQPSPKNQAAADTISINQALERVQQENILDGFWMHHRWKCTREFAPKQDASVAELSQAFVRIPFRIVAALPHRLEESLTMIPALRALKASRFDAQLLVIAPEAQREFWCALACVDVFASDDAPRGLKQQLESEAIYQDGPFDLLVMWGGSKAVMKAVLSQGPLYISGFEDDALSKSFKSRALRSTTGPAQARYLDYLAALKSNHYLEVDDAAFTAVESCSEESPAARRWIAPISSLGLADAWPLAQWRELIAAGGAYHVLALQEDAAAAQQLAAELQLPCQLCTPTSLKNILGRGSVVVTVDGALAQLAALYGAQGAVLMASRLPDCYAPWGGQMKPFYQHVSCHPCYQQNCTAAQACLAQVAAQDVLAHLSTLA